MVRPDGDDDQTTTEMSEISARILVVEDDMLIAMDIASMVEKCGFTVIGPVGRLDKALDAARQTELDGAVIDIQLDGERVWPLAELLQDRGVPTVLLSGHSRAEMPQRFSDLPLLSKPVSGQLLQRALGDVGLTRA